MNDVIQNTAEWHQQRLGKVTASRVADVIAKTKSGYSTSRANYMAQLIAERLTGEVVATYTNIAMNRGLEIEPDARAAYVFHTDADVTEVGFVEHPTIPMTGASPDGLVGTDGLIEIKCPLTATHIDTLLGEPIPAKYITQIMWQLACTGRQWCDFVSFDPRLPEAMRLYIWRVVRDNALIASLENSVCEFLIETEKKVVGLTARYPMHKAAS